MREKTVNKLKPLSQQQGAYKCAVFFLDHKLKSSFKMYSTKGQDKRGISINHFKELITQKWRDKVSWAAIYEGDRQILEFRIETGQWLTV